mmetsp:Transcript_31983/g.52817  ORF Transcript_31983/g.52817 Transcript_31983/m.52817 type:complete len:277 (-) Transcript_31983:49-879(-)
MSLRRYTETDKRWSLFWFGIPVFPSEHAFTVDQFRIWRRHLVWSKLDAGELRTILTQRFSSNSVFLSLLLSAEIAILFSPSEPADEVRKALKGYDIGVAFFAGLMLCIAIFVSAAGLYATFSAWAIVSTVSDSNTHGVLRSSLGLYCCTLPSRLIVAALYIFVFDLALFFFVVMPLQLAPFLTAGGFILLIHISSTYSAMGRIIMETGAMGEESIFHRHEEETKTPHELLQNLIAKLEAARNVSVPVNEQYRMESFQESLREVMRSTGTVSGRRAE